MRIRFAIYSVTVILLSAGIAQADIYTCKDANGNVVYTDSPGGCANAEEVTVDTLPTLVPSKSLPTSSSGSSVIKDEDKIAYNELVITSPSNDATVRDNQGNLTINFRATPALQTRKGHKYVVTLDGTEIYSGSSTITALKNIDRGTHSIGVKVVAQDGSTKISAKPVKITLQRFSSLNNPDSNSIDANQGVGNANNENNTDDNPDNDDPETIITNQKFPSNTKFNRPATPPPPPASN